MQVRVGKDSRDQRTTKKLSVVADWQWWPHTWTGDLTKVYHEHHLYTTLHCRATARFPCLPHFTVHVCACGVCVEVLDISIIGLAIAGLVHMLPRLSFHTQPYLTLSFNLSACEGWPMLWWWLWLSALCDTPFPSPLMGFLVDMATVIRHNHYEILNTSKCSNFIMDRLPIFTTPGYHNPLHG